MNLDPLIALAAPFVFALMAGEAALGRRQGKNVYSAATLFSDLSCSAASLIGRGLVGVSATACYLYVATHLSLTRLSASAPWVWILGFVLMDLMLYTRHRACHRVAIFWAMHAVHHQSTHLNLGTGQRVPWLQDLQFLPFVLLPAWLGFPFEVFAAHFTLATLWAFWTHTQVISKLGWIEYIVITPSHHRVHHGRNQPYIDKNFGAVLVLWDKLFGTFQEETIAIEYGDPHSADALSAFGSNAQPLVMLANKARRAPSIFSAIETLFRPPGWCPRTRKEAQSTQEVHPSVPMPTSVSTKMMLWKGLGLASCFALGLIPLGLPNTPLWARGMIAIWVFGLLGWLSRSRQANFSTGKRASA